MSVTKPYNRLPAQLRIRAILSYLSVGVLMEGDYDYTVVEPFDNATESAYNAITWNDIRAKPTWTTIQANVQPAWDWTIEREGYGAFSTDTDTVDVGVFTKRRLNYSDQYIIEGLEPDIAANTSAIAGKADTSHTHVANDITSGTKTSSFISDFQTAARNAISASGAGGSYNASTGVISLNGTTFTFTNPTRSLNTAFQISANQNALVTYSVDIACNLSLSGGQKGTVYLEYADNSGMTTNLVTVQSATNSQTGTLTIGLNTTGEASAAVSGVIPAGKYVRLRTENNTGTPTFTYRRAQEVLAA